VNKLFIVIAGVALLIMAGSGYYFFSQQSQSNNTAKTESTEAQISAPETQEAAQEVPGKYLPYTEAAFEEARDTDRLLFFYANWCPTCRPVDKAIQAQAADIPSGVTILRVNYNDTETDQMEKDLAKRYAVT
jgi:thiol-disulfide isomerase/thioredoxin